MPNSPVEELPRALATSPALPLDDMDLGNDGSQSTTLSESSTSTPQPMSEAAATVTTEKTSESAIIQLLVASTTGIIVVPSSPLANGKSEVR